MNTSISVFMLISEALLMTSCPISMSSLISVWKKVFIEAARIGSNLDCYPVRKGAGKWKKAGWPPGPCADYVCVQEQRCRGRDLLSTSPTPSAVAAEDLRTPYRWYVAFDWRMDPWQLNVLSLLRDYNRRWLKASMTLLWPSYLFTGLMQACTDI